MHFDRQLLYLALAFCIGRSTALPTEELPSPPSILNPSATKSSPHELRQVSATTATQNALSVLEGALPSSIVSALNSDASSFLATFLHPASSAAAFSHSSFAPSSSPTNIFSSTPASRSSTVATTSSSATPSSSSTTTTPAIIPHTTQTLQSTTRQHAPTTTSTSSTTSATTPAQTTNAPPHSSPSHPISNAAVAGIASSASAAAIVLLLAALYLTRRHKQGKPLLPFALAIPFLNRSSSKRSAASSGIYPKSAWLYDPVITPPNHSRRGSEVEQNLLSLDSSGRHSAFLPRHSRGHSADAELEADMGFYEADLGMPSPSFRGGAERSQSPTPFLPEIHVSMDQEGLLGSYSNPAYLGGGGGRRGRPMMDDISEDEE